MNETIDYFIPNDQIIYYIDTSKPNEKEWLKLIKLPFLAYRLYKYCDRNNISAIMSVMNRPNLIATMSRYFGFRGKILISEQFYTPFFYNNKSIGGIIKSKLIESLYPTADVILPNSYGTKYALENLFSIRSLYQVVKNPTDISHINHVKNELIDENEIVFNKFTFVNVAAFRVEKNHDLLINAFAQLRRNDCQLLLIGKGQLKSKIQEKVKLLDLQHLVKFIDFTNNPYKYLHKSDCFVLSSDSEGFPNVLIEAMACSLPIISVDCKTGPRELLAPSSDINMQLTNTIEFGEYGILTPVSDVNSLSNIMKKVLNEPALLLKYKDKLYKKAIEFENSTVVKEWEQIILQNH